LLTVTGWGDKNNEGELSDDLLTASLTATDLEWCKQALDSYSFEESKHICARSKNQDTCRGDGGGLYIYLKINCYLAFKN